MNMMIQYVDNNDSSDFFERLTITRVKIARRVMQYLKSTCDGDINIDTLNYLKTDNIVYAIGNIFNETGFYTESNYWTEKTYEETEELINYLMPEYKKISQTIKDKRREELLKELKELDGE